MNTKILAAAFALLLTAGSASALPPPMFTYSGYLRDSTGTPVTASSNLTFRLYADPTTPTVLYQETIAVVPNADGYFSAIVGGTAVLGPEAFQVPRYLTIEFGAEGEMAPRIPLTSVPSAFSALTVDWTGVVNAPAVVTSVTASLPLSSTGGATPNLTIAAADGVVTGALRPTDFNNFAGKQARVSGSCTVGSAIRAIAADGTVTCQAVPVAPTCSNTTYAFTTGGTASVNCAAGQIATGGGVYCSVGTSVTMTRPETNGWAAQCSAAGTHTLYVRCCTF